MRGNQERDPILLITGVSAGSSGVAGVQKRVKQAKRRSRKVVRKRLSFYFEKCHSPEAFSCGASDAVVKLSQNAVVFCEWNLVAVSIFYDLPDD